MHLWLQQCVAVLMCSLIYSPSLAGQLAATLTTQLELLPSCVINGQDVEQGSVGLQLGQLDFGETTAAFHGIIQTKLTHGSSSGLTIQCSGNSPIKITFAAGQHDQKVPVAFAQNYFRAVSNGTDYLAYNLLYGSNAQVLQPNESIILNNNGQTYILDLSGQVINNGQAVSRGSYSDIIPIIIEF